MTRGIGGIGSASMVLVFAVLCLVIFTMISLVPALNEDALIESEVRLVRAYYAADVLAERILAEILATDHTPSSILDTEINSVWCWDLSGEVIYFICEISDAQGLYVRIVRFFDGYEILAWRMVNLTEWEPDHGLDVWQGEFFMGW